MNCEKNIRRYLMQDNTEKIPLIVRLHVSRCSRCRAEITKLSKELSRLRETNDIVMPMDITDSIMARVAMIRTKPREANITRWVVAGGTIIFGIALLSFSETLSEMQDFFGSDLDFPLHLVLGLIITFYASITAAVHLTRLKTRFLHRDIKQR